MIPKVVHIDLRGQRIEFKYFKVSSTTPTVKNTSKVDELTKNQYLFSRGFTSNKKKTWQGVYDTKKFANL